MGSGRRTAAVAGDIDRRAAVPGTSQNLDDSFQRVQIESSDEIFEGAKITACNRFAIVHDSPQCRFGISTVSREKTGQDFPETPPHPVT